ncbi:MAG: tetratricopeptide repeat protein [Pseudomonadota bacterium]
MLQDLNGLDVSIASTMGRDAWNATQAAFLAHSAATPQRLTECLGAAPDFALGHAAKGLFYLLLGRAELVPAARLALDAAVAGHADAREAIYVRALRAALRGHMALAANMLDDLLAIWPRDALAMKLVHALRFVSGDAAGMRASLDAVAPQWHDHPLRGYFMGCQAFALEETGAYQDAERLGRAGLDLAPDDAWGLHAVAHVYDMTGRAAEGVRWLTGRSAHWQHCNNFGYHVWWHLALFHIDRGAIGPALALYDRKVRPVESDDFRDIANAASLLIRLEIEGAETGRRWDGLADLAARRVDDGSLVFADLHYQLALIRAGRSAEAVSLADRLARDAGLLTHDQHEVAALCGTSIARGLLMFRDAAYAEALDALTLGLRKLNRIGGSHAQRDVFWRLAVEAALRAGRIAQARALLDQRRLARGSEDGYMRRSIDRIEARARMMNGMAAE